MDAIRQKIENLLKNKDLSMHQASLLMGRGSAYLHSYLKRGKPFDLPEDARHELAPILGVSPDDLRGSVKKKRRPRHSAVEYTKSPPPNPDLKVPHEEMFYHLLLNALPALDFLGKSGKKIAASQKARFLIESYKIALKWWEPKNFRFEDEFVDEIQALADKFFPD